MRPLAVLSFPVLACFVLPLTSQIPRAPGGNYSQLIPEQQALVQRWADEYQKVTGKQLDPEASYDALPISSRTTFEAVTHALAHSTLTDSNGKPLGRALDLVDLVERIAGRVPETRGDAQFRVYVYLKPDALEKLYAAREFRRDHDNTVYHIGYPINFRQSGTPSVQFSIARTGKRADIDVDYRSSAMVKAVFDGHLTAANSDVRAGNNLVRHNGRWAGFANWWQSIIAELFGGDSLKADETSGGNDEPIVPPNQAAWDAAAKGTVVEAAHMCLKEWLEDGDPADVLRAISVKAYPCIADFEDGSRPDSKLALLRILTHMQSANQRVGDVAKLEDVVEAVDYPLPGATIIPHAQSGVFQLQLVPEDVAWALDCRVRYRLHLAESIPQPPNVFDGTYTTAFRLKPDPSNEFLLVFWQKQGKEWRIVSFDLQRSLEPVPPDLVAKAHGNASFPDPQVGEEASRAAEQMMTTWLLRKKPNEALASFAPDAYTCDEAKSRARLLDLLTTVSSTGGRGRTLGEIIEPPEAGHHAMEPVPHSNSGTFLLARVSDDLASNYACSRTGNRTGFREVYLTAFRSSAVRDESPVVVLLFWEKRNNRWQVISYDFADD
jgi:hypothetical protein